MRMLRVLARALPGAAIVIVPAAQAAASLPLFCTPQKPGSSPTTVDKEEFAGAILDDAKVSRKTEDYVLKMVANGRLAQNRVLGPNAATVMYGIVVCPPQKATKVAGGDVNQPGCSDSDRQALSAAYADATSSINSDPGLIVTRTPEQTPTKPDEFFTELSITLVCKTPTVAAPKADQGSKSGNTVDIMKVRIRDTAANLIYDKNDPNFSNAGKSTISFSDDRIAGKKSVTIDGAIGYPISLTPASEGYNGPALNLVPYSAFNISTAKVTGKAESISSDTIELGAIFSLDAPLNGFAYNHSNGFNLTLDPKFIMNNRDHSRVVGADLILWPYITGGINTATSFGPINWNFIANARINGGHFTTTGSRTAVNAEDFARLGGQLGLVLASKPNATLPFDLTVSDIYMRSLTGYPKNLSLLSSDLSVYFNAKKNFGLDVAYSRGRAADLDSDVHKWTIGLAIKY